MAGQGDPALPSETTRTPPEVFRLPLQDMPEQGRKQAFSVQLLQLLDAALIWLAFWVASLLREPLFDVTQALVARLVGHSGFLHAPSTKSFLGAASSIVLGRSYWAPPALSFLRDDAFCR